MSDILSVLEQQTSQTENLIARLQQRLEQTNQLRALEHQRQELVGTIARLDERLSGIDAELAALRLPAATGETDLAAVTTKFQTTWGSIFHSDPTVSTPLPSPLPAAGSAPSPALSLFAGATVEDFGGLDLDPSGPAEETEAWPFDSGLFSAAEELQDAESPDEWTWWGDDEQPAGVDDPPAAVSPLINDDFPGTAMYGDGAVMFETMPLSTTESGSPGKRKGILGRFF